jgi:hypothetical protein
MRHHQFSKRVKGLPMDEKEPTVPVCAWISFGGDLGLEIQLRSIRTEKRLEENASFVGTGIGLKIFG